MKAALACLRKTATAMACVAGALALWSAPALAKDDIVLCTVDDLSGDFSIMSTPKTYGYQPAVKEVNDAGGIEVDGAKKLIRLVSYDGQSNVNRYQEMAQAWEKAGTTDTDTVIKALEEDISIPDAPGGPWTLRGDQHHAAMHTYLFKVDEQHKLNLVTDLGLTEPTFLTEVGVNMREAAPGQQFLPPNNPNWKSFFGAE